MKIPFVDLRAAYAELQGELDAAYRRVAASGWYLLGPETEAFEDEFARYCGVRHCATVGDAPVASCQERGGARKRSGSWMRKPPAIWRYERRSGTGRAAISGRMFRRSGYRFADENMRKRETGGGRDPRHSATLTGRPKARRI